MHDAEMAWRMRFVLLFPTKKKLISTLRVFLKEMVECLWGQMEPSLQHNSECKI
jgi:hypothetical protein